MTDNLANEWARQQQQEKLSHLVQEYFPQAKVLVIGDPMVDVYHFGRVTKLSQEAPVPVFVEDYAQRREGGAMNVIKNLRALGVQAEGVFPRASWTEKHRFLVGHQQIFRVDNDSAHETLHLETETRELMAWCDVAILSDYGKGCLGEEFCQAFIGEMQATKPVIVDPRGGNWEKYIGATVLCPNEHEWAEHISDRTRPTRPIFPYLLLKLGAAGMQLGEGRVLKSSDVIWKSHTRARQVFDVTGAGDTVIAVFSAAAAAGVYSKGGTNFVDAAELANMAAGVVVGKVGTATCSREELLEEIDRG
jgi:rfaE bifunctional protein kinase chain/domain